MYGIHRRTLISQMFCFPLNSEEIEISNPSTPERSPTPTASPSTVRKRPPEKVRPSKKPNLFYTKDKVFKTNVLKVVNEKNKIVNVIKCVM